MDEHDYGPLRTYEVTWVNRAPEIVQGHSVQFESGGFSPFPGEPKMRIYGMFPGGQWRLVLMGLEKNVESVRDVTDHLAALEAMASEEVTGDGV